MKTPTQLLENPEKYLSASDVISDDVTLSFNYTISLVKKTLRTTFMVDWRCNTASRELIWKQNSQGQQ